MNTKKTKRKGRQAQLSAKRARNRVIENCWRSEKLGSGGCVKIIQMAADILKAHGTLPAAASSDTLLSEAEKIARSRGFKATYKKRAPVHKAKPIKSGSRKKASNEFYASWEWKKARYDALTLHGRQCMCCGFTPYPGCKERLVVDHIKPRSKFPDLALDVSNLQVLCNSCNMGKSNIHQHDFRAEWHGEDENDEVDPLAAQFMATMQ